MSQQAGDPMDPLGTWRAMRDTYMDAWSKSMIDLVSSEAYTEATGRMLDNYLTVSSPFKKSLESSMTQLLAQLNMPTRSDVTSLAERLTNVEMRLDDLDEKMDTLERNILQAVREAHRNEEGVTSATPASPRQSKVASPTHSSSSESGAERATPARRGGSARTPRKQVKS